MVDRRSQAASPAIAYLVSQYPAPSHTFIRREIAALRAQGCEIVSFSVRPPIADTGDPEDLSTAVILAQPWHAFILAPLCAGVSNPARFLGTLGLALRHRVPGGRALAWALFHFVEAMVLARLLRRARAIHLHNHFANSGATVGMLAAHFLSLPWSMTLHGISETDYPAGVLLGRKIERARFVACATWFGQAQAMRMTTPDQWAKLSVVRCGIDLSNLPAAQAAPTEPVRVICVGRLSPEKGHAGLLQAFSQIGAHAAGARLEIVGDGPEGEALRALTAELGLTDRVVFRGRLSERETLCAIGAADILVLPSFMEGLPLVLVEAMALGKPVVASAVAGIPELVANEETGLLFRPSDWAMLAAALERIIEDAELRKRLGRSGRSRVEAEFAIDRAVLPLVSLFPPTPGPR